MAQKTINATCNNVTKRVNRTQARFNITDSKGNNAGNVNIKVNENGNADSLSGFEPGTDYKIVIKEA